MSMFSCRRFSVDQTICGRRTSVEQSWHFYSRRTSVDQSYVSRQSYKKSRGKLNDCMSIYSRRVSIDTINRRIYLANKTPNYKRRFSVDHSIYNRLTAVDQKTKNCRRLSVDQTCNQRRSSVDQSCYYQGISEIP